MLFLFYGPPSGKDSPHSVHWRPRDLKAAEWRRKFAELPREGDCSPADRPGRKLSRPRWRAQWRLAWPFPGGR